MPVWTEILAAEPSVGWSSEMVTEISVSLVLRSTEAVRISADIEAVYEEGWEERASSQRATI